MNESSGVRQVYILTVGWVEMPKSYSVFGLVSDEMIKEPVPVVLVETVEGWVMFDTGYNKMLLEDPALYKRFHGRFQLIKPEIPKYEFDPLLDILGGLNIRPDEISKVALSHLHNDHSGGIRNFSDSALIYIQEKELQFAFSDQARSDSEGYARIDYDDPAINWQIVSGDCEIAPGVDGVFTPGHTPGHMSFVVHFDGVEGGGLVFACDAGDLRQNFDQCCAIGGFIDVGPSETIEQIKKLKEIANGYGYQIMPGHDPDVWPTINEGLVRRLL